MIMKQRLFYAVLSVFFVIMLGAFGYYFIYDYQESFLDCLYMTVISLTTVGYGEVIDVSGDTGAKIFTMFLIVFGMGIILYGAGTLTAVIVEGELSGMIRRKHMKTRIGEMSGHYIVCGGGETGRPVVEEILKNREACVLIDKDEDSIEKCRNAIRDLLFIHGDVTEDENLVSAGIEKAAGIIITLPSDQNNLYVTMTARMLNPTMRIISRMTDPRLEPKLYKAGANGVVSTNMIGALRLASEMIRPTVVNFLDSMLRSKDGVIRISQVYVPKNSRLAGKTIREGEFKRRFNLLLLGIREKDGDMEFDPDVEKVIKEETTLIFMGEIGNFFKARKWLAS